MMRMKKSCRGCEAYSAGIYRFINGNSPAQCKLGFEMEMVENTPTPQVICPKPLTYRHYGECLQDMLDRLKKV